MKRIFLCFILAAFCLAASANEVRYFTYHQMTRTVSYLNAQQELMIWCGYPDEIETYCLVNEVWAEKVNAQYYEVWLYGYDAWTGEEIYMPLDLGCIWLLGAGHKCYNAATYLRFRNGAPMPSFVWYIPPYHPFERHHHVHGYVRTYHHHVHQPGWHHPDPHHNPHHCHPYYMRPPEAPVYFDPTPYHPGQGRPNVSPVRPTDSHANATSPRTTGHDGYRTYTRGGGAVSGTETRTPNAGSNTGSGTRTPNAGGNTGSGTRTPSAGTQTGSGTRTPSTGTQTGSGTRTPSTGTQTGSGTRTPSTGTQTGSGTRTPSTGTSTGSGTRTPSTGTSTGSGTRTSGTTTTSGTRTSGTSAQLPTTPTNNNRGTSTGTSTNRGTNTNTGTRTPSTNNRGTSTGTRTSGTRTTR